MDRSLYWTPHDILTKNAMFNFVIGGRGTGKTYGSLKHCVRHFIKTRRLFIYLRRYDTDLAKKERLLNDVSKEFPDHEFRIEGQKIMIKHVKATKFEIMGYVMPLSMANSDKSVPFNEVDYIIYDEFILAKGMQHYIRNEPELFIDFYNTVDRMHDRVRVLLLANSVSIVNPYFLYFKLNPRKGKRIKSYRNGYIALQMLDSPKFKEAADDSRFGQMIKGTAYYDYAVGNEFSDDNDKFIREKSPAASYHSSLKFDNRTLSIWCDYEDGCYYVSSKRPKNERVYALTREDLTPNMVMISRSSQLLRMINKLYMQGLIYFDCVKTREGFYQILDYLNLR